MTIDTSKISKTTLNGLLTFAIIAMISVKFDAAGHLAMTARDWVAVAIGVARAAVGFSQQDAGSTPAIPLGGGEPQQVPSHEVPDDPAATPVVK